jgi:Zn-dependent protease
MKFSFSKKEIKDLLIAVLFLSAAFTILMSNNNYYVALLNFPVMLLVVIFSFVIHELSHKYFAIKFKYHAEFRAHVPMLILAVVMSFFGFIFAAPGAVYFSGHKNKKKLGIIALAGPLSNLVIAIISLILAFLINSNLFSLLFFVNSILAFFNLLPFPGFDGNKVVKWNKVIYFCVFIFSILLYVVPTLF